MTVWEHAHTHTERKTSCQVGGIDRQQGQSPHTQNYSEPLKKTHHIIDPCFKTRRHGANGVCVRGWLGDTVFMACQICHSTQKEAQTVDTVGRVSRMIYNVCFSSTVSAYVQRHDM